MGDENSSSKPARRAGKPTPGGVRTDAGGRPKTDDGGRPLVKDK